MIVILKNLLIILYLITFSSYLVFFIKKSYFLSKLLLPVLFSTIASHISFLVILIIAESQKVPITSSSDFLSFLAFSLITIYASIEIKMREKSTGFFVTGLASLFYILSNIFSKKTAEINPILFSPFVAIHTLFAIFGYAGFCITFIYSLLYLMLLKNIKSRKFGLIYIRLPSLETMGQMNFRACITGFSFLTVSLILGTIWFAKVYGLKNFIDPKIITAIVIWLIFGISWIAKKTFARGGLFSAYLSFFGLTVLVFSISIVKLIFPTFHLFD